MADMGCDRLLTAIVRFVERCLRVKRKSLCLMSDKKIMVTRSSMPSFEEYCEEIRPLWETHMLSNGGAKHQQFTEALEQYLDVPAIQLFVNGHSALECLLDALDLKADGRNEIITTPYTFVSTTNAIVRRGYKPVFVDIKSDDFTMDPSKIEALITDKTCAILPVHVYGNICDVEEIQQIADKYDLKVIYDAAHAFGTKKNGISVGNFGDASMFSFHASKVFNSIEGGAIAHNSDQLSKALSQWRNFGIASAERVVYPGGNAKMNEFTASMGICNLRHVDEEISKRKTIAERYFDNLDGVKGLRIIRPNADEEHNYIYMPIVFEDEFGTSRDMVAQALLDRGIVARKYFYPLVTDADCYRGDYDSFNTPIARDAADRVLTLPMYADLALEDVDRICDIVKNNAQ